VYKRFAKSFRRLAEGLQLEVLEIIESLATSSNPAALGEPLRGNLRGMYRVRFGPRRAYRLIYSVSFQTITIEYINVGHRRKIYEKLRRRL